MTTATALEPATRWAFKEWAAVCAALRTGAQSLILRKGGIHEGRAGFRVEHRQFWLFATGFHQRGTALVDPESHLWTAAQHWMPVAGSIVLPAFAVVEQTLALTRIEQLPRLSGWHCWSDETIRQRFEYRGPGLQALIVRVYRAVEPLHLPDSPHFGGCRSWVDLPNELSTEGLTPVLDDSQFAATHEGLLRALSDATIV